METNELMWIVKIIGILVIVSQVIICLFKAPSINKKINADIFGWIIAIGGITATLLIAFYGGYIRLF